MRLNWLVLAAAATVAVSIVLGVFGTRIVNPFDLSWFAGDVVVAQFGVQQYLDDPNHTFPVASDRYSYPLDMPVALYDCFPILAFIVKIIFHEFDKPFQYFGIVFVTGILIQVALSWLLLKSFIKEHRGIYINLSLFIGILFLTLAPTLFVRFYLSHMSLSLHWQMIAAMWLYIISIKYSFIQNIRNFSILLFISGAITPYTAVMVSIIYLSFPILLILKKELNVKKLAMCFVPLISGFIPLVLFSFFEFGGKPVIPGSGYGYFSANMNTFFNPMSDLFGSFFFSDLEMASYEQYEGFAYLGAGAIVAIAVGLIVYLKNIQSSEAVLPLALTSLFCFFLALSTSLSIGAVSVDVPIPQQLYKVLEIFRSSGRFIWVPGYFLLFLSVGSIIRFLQPKPAFAVLALAGIIQAIDIKQPLENMSDKFSARFGADHFTEAAYADLGLAHDTLIVLPAWQCQDPKLTTSDYGWREQYGFPNLAMKNRLRTNSFYAGRSPVDHVRYHCLEYPATLIRKPADIRSAYLLTPKTFARLGGHVAKTHFCDFAQAHFICRGDKQQAGLSERAKSAIAAGIRPAVASEPTPEKMVP